jgi:AraC-like DNA-binding protein
MSEEIKEASQFNYENELILKDNSYKEANFHKWGPGIREVYALHYIISGKGFLETNQMVYEVQAGEAFLIFPDTEVYYYPSRDDPWEYVWIDFCGSRASQFVSKTVFTKEMPVGKARCFVESSFYIFDKETDPFIRQERYKFKLQSLLTYFYMNTQLERNLKGNEHISMAIEYIENNYWKSSFNVTSIVKYLNMDRTYLFRLFKKTTGTSIAHYLINYRLKKACRLLVSSKLPIKSIACSVGFEDPMYFSRVFHKNMHLSPSNYRNNVQLPDSR